jgi:hypothetical protein
MKGIAPITKAMRRGMNAKQSVAVTWQVTLEQQSKSQRDRTVVPSSLTALRTKGSRQRFCRVPQAARQISSEGSFSRVRRAGRHPIKLEIETMSTLRLCTQPRARALTWESSEVRKKNIFSKF